MVGFSSQTVKLVGSFPSLYLSLRGSSMGPFLPVADPREQEVNEDKLK